MIFSHPISTILCGTFPTVPVFDVSSAIRLYVACLLLISFSSTNVKLLLQLYDIIMKFAKFHQSCDSDSLHLRISAGSRQNPTFFLRLLKVNKMSFVPHIFSPYYHTRCYLVGCHTFQLVGEGSKLN